MTNSISQPSAVPTPLYRCLTAALALWVWNSCSEPDQTPAPPAPQHRFVQLDTDAGFTQTHVGGSPEKSYIVEAKGGGSAVLDYDGDGNLDIYWVNGAALNATYPNTGNILYRNNGTETFVDVSAAAQVSGMGWGMGAVSADHNNDGHADLYVTCLQENILFRNRGNGSFADVSAKAHVNSADWSTGAAFGDYDLDGDLDLYVAHYVHFDPNQVEPLSAQWKGVDVFTGPLGLPAVPDVLYRNRDNGTFDDVSDSTGIRDVEAGYGLGVLFTDLDNDGASDLYIANDSTPNFLWHNNRDGTFTEMALHRGVAFGEMGNAQAGMGVTSGDYNGDGHTDIFVTNFEDDYNTLYRNNGDTTFSDVSFAVGLGRIALPFVGFGTGFFDADNDGDLDLLVANGHVYPQVDTAGTGSSYSQADFLFENHHSKFKLVLPQRGDSLGTSEVSRGAEFADFDNDGDLDIFITRLNGRPVLMRNEWTAGRNWIGLELIGAQANRDAVGARVVLYANDTSQFRQVTAGGSYLGSSDRRLHFGLGTVASADSLHVHWPGGTIETWRDLPINRYLILLEGQVGWRLPPL